MNPETIGSIAGVVTALTALLALTFAFWQTRQFRRHQIEAVAREQYQNYLELCIKYPDLAPPRAGALDVAARTFDGSTEKFTQYEWFFTAGSNALEAIFETVGETGEWKATILSIMGDHREYLSSARYDEVQRATVLPSFQRLVDQAILGRK